MVKKLEFGLVLSVFDEKIGPIPVASYPEYDEEVGAKIALKSINLMWSDESRESKSAAFLPFPSEDKKGIVKNFIWKDDVLRDKMGSGALTLLFDENDDAIYYKYIKDIEVVLDKAISRIVELKISRADNRILNKELIKIHKDFLTRLKELSDHEIGSGELSEAFPDEEQKSTEDYSFKVIVCGDGGVGKTSSILRFTERAFRRTYIPTLGVNITRKQVKLKKNSTILLLWDIAGQIKFQVTRKNFYKGASGVLLIFDVTRPETFSSISNWYKDIMGTLKDDAPYGMILCANKIDLGDERKINSEKGKALADDLKMDYLEMSALSGENIDLAFETLAKKLSNE